MKRGKSMECWSEINPKYSHHFIQLYQEPGGWHLTALLEYFIFKWVMYINYNKVTRLGQ